MYGKQNNKTGIGGKFQKQTKEAEISKQWNDTNKLWEVMGISGINRTYCS